MQHQTESVSESQYTFIALGQAYKMGAEHCSQAGQGAVPVATQEEKIPRQEAPIQVDFRTFFTKDKSSYFQKLFFFLSVAMSRQESEIGVRNRRIFHRNRGVLITYLQKYEHPRIWAARQFVGWHRFWETSIVFWETSIVFWETSIVFY